MLRNEVAAVGISIRAVAGTPAGDVAVEDVAVADFVGDRSPSIAGGLSTQRGQQVAGIVWFEPRNLNRGEVQGRDLGARHPAGIPNGGNGARRTAAIVVETRGGNRVVAPRARGREGDDDY